MAMGTVMSHKVYGLFAEECLDAIQYEIEHLENLFSRFIPSSEIRLINQNAGLKPIPVSFETYEVLSAANELSSRCGSVFDITINPLVHLWTTTLRNNQIPSVDNISKTMRLVNFRDLVLDPVERTAFLQQPGQAIDLGGIGKGYASKKILEIFATFGIHCAYSNLGGNVISIGEKLDGSPWRIGIQHPRNEKDLVGCISIRDQVVVTAGDYQRYVIGLDGKRYHHILNPVSGYPAQSGLISVTIVSRDAIVADVLSTAILIAGEEKGLEIIAGFPGTEAILVNQSQEILITQGLKDFQSNERFIVV